MRNSTEILSAINDHRCWSKWREQTAGRPLRLAVLRNTRGGLRHNGAVLELGAREQWNIRKERAHYNCITLYSVFSFQIHLYSKLALSSILVSTFQFLIANFVSRMV